MELVDFVGDDFWNWIVLHVVHHEPFIYANNSSSANISLFLWYSTCLFESDSLINASSGDDVNQLKSRNIKWHSIFAISIHVFCIFKPFMLTNCAGDRLIDSH